MHIVVLDGGTTNPGDLPFDAFKAFGTLTYYADTKEDEVVSRAKDADVIIVNKTPLCAQTIDRLPKLRYIGLISTGYDPIDVAHAGKRGIPVTNVPAYSAHAVAQMTVAHILNLTNHVAQLSDRVKTDGWLAVKHGHFSYLPLAELKDKTLGLFGFGNIAKQVAKTALSFDMRVFACARHAFSFPGVTQVSKDELFKSADILSLHVPYTKQTHQIINAQTIAQMKDGVLIINTARGRLIDEAALGAALRTGKVGGFGTDVLFDEPPRKDNPLFDMPNVFITPHVAWSAYETRKRLLCTAVSNLQSYLNGTPVNLVNEEGLQWNIN